MKIKFLILSLIVSISLVSPVFAEVVQMELDGESYLKGDSIHVSGEVTEDETGLVTIVIRDSNDKFVLLSQAMIQSDNSFENTIDINEKFQLFGSYNATGFITNMTEGKIQSFDIISSKIKKIDEPTKKPSEESKIVVPQNEPEIIKTTTLQEPVLEKTLEEQKNIPVVEEIKSQEIFNSQIADFVDISKNPQHYIDRYYNEPTYQSWFDRNYPDLSIEEAVGYNPQLIEPEAPKISNPEIIPTAEATSLNTPVQKAGSNSDSAQMALAIGGLAILLGAVYGIKRKVDNNTRHIFLNKESIKRKLISPITHSNPHGILQTRLAKGEITLEEYDRLKEKLNSR